MEDLGDNLTDLSSPEDIDEGQEKENGHCTEIAYQSQGFPANSRKKERRRIVSRCWSRLFQACSFPGNFQYIAFNIISLVFLALSTLLVKSKLIARAKAVKHHGDSMPLSSYRQIVRFL